MSLFLNIVLALLFGFLIWRLWPAAKDRIENGPRGTQKQWLNVSVLLAGVVLFVALLMALVGG